MVEYADKEIIHCERNPNSAGKLKDVEDFFGKKRDCPEKNSCVDDSQEEINKI